VRIGLLKKPVSVEKDTLCAIKKIYLKRNYNMNDIRTAMRHFEIEIMQKLMLELLGGNPSTEYRRGVCDAARVLIDTWEELRKKVTAMDF